MALKIGGEAMFPSHDPDQQDAGLALELAAAQARDAVILAARDICPNVDAVAGEGYIQALEDALATLDAAVAAADAHDSTVGVAVCRECGCTDSDACIVEVLPVLASSPTLEACHWVEADLCSGCKHGTTVHGPNRDRRRG